MNPLTKVKLINELNDREARLSVKDSVSWHQNYKDSAWIFLDFSDVLAEPNSFHSFDKVWTWSDILFESSKLWCYRIISLLCAVPVSLISGILFATLGCIHIWCAMPCIQLCNICMPPIRTLWASLLDIFIAPLCSSLGRCLSFIYVNVTKQRA
ncbi:caveolin-2-like isoform X3 [Aquarana catesbeiana]|uniref:caveolin-2-like isoform X3 n=1 Tax=Aquarana catesbeiana TaxID=8400 RepID=UPI003CCA37A2